MKKIKKILRAIGCCLSQWLVGLLLIALVLTAPMAIIMFIEGIRCAKEILNDESND